MLRAIAIGLLAALLGSGGRAGAATDKQDFAQIERGRYLTVLGDCAACHTMPGGQPFAGGRPIQTPFGTVLAPNVTPDMATGIGAWTNQQFVDALAKGVGAGGDHLYPAMPYTYFTKVTREDALAIRAYLATVKPVANQVHSNQLPFPFDIRAVMAIWDALFFKEVRFQPVPGKTADWNRGAYLVEGLMHCGMCHTRKNFLGGDETSKALQGYALQGWFAPNITGDERRGLGKWSVDEIVAYLKSGHNQVAAASGPMAEEVSQSSSKVTDADLRAVATYLKDQPGQADDNATPVAAGGAAMKTGAAIFGDECSACHTPNGGGIADLYPALNGGPAVQSTQATSVIHVILAGTRSVGTDSAPTAPGMPAFGALLDDDQVAAVATYVRNAWGNAAPAVTASDVRKMRDALAKAE
jgi:mono/diheme cytochrome c family protein